MAHGPAQQHLYTFNEAITLFCPEKPGYGVSPCSFPKSVMPIAKIGWVLSKVFLQILIRTDSPCHFWVRTNPICLSTLPELLGCVWVYALGFRSIWHEGARAEESLLKASGAT